MRHPQDPDPVADTKATAAFGLGLLGVVTAVAIGGIVPATIALLLARQARAELVQGQGWRTGAGRIRWAERLAWTGLAVAAVTLVALSVLLVLRGVPHGTQDFPPNVN